MVMGTKITLRELQLLQLEIAKEIKRICDENEIDYFIIGGTLLGAVRHKGFIPWDDDMDIGMTIDNYNRFLIVAAEKMDTRFFLQTPNSDSAYFNIFSKVRLKKTHIFEKVSEKLGMNDGIFVDIFPYDLVSEKTAKSRLYMKTLQLLGKMSLLKHGYDLNGITEGIVSKCVNNMIKNFPVSVKIIDKKMSAYIKSNRKNNKKTYYIERDGMFRGNFVFPESYFSKLIELSFENIIFKAPKEYDKYLKHAYGNYMEYPSEHERKKGHSISEIILECDYNSYFK